jgi:hypothetical protein
MHFKTVSVPRFRIQRKVSISFERFILSPDGNKCCIKIINLKNIFSGPHTLSFYFLVTHHMKVKKAREIVPVFPSVRMFCLRKLLLNIWTKYLIKMCPKIILNHDKILIIFIYKLVFEFHNSLGIIQKTSPEQFGYVRRWKVMMLS